MRLYLLPLAFVLLASCNPEPESGPRVDLVGSSRFLSASRISTNPADTFSTRVFADKRDEQDPDLKYLRIQVAYTPTRYPYAYPPGVAYDPELVPKETAPLIFFDSLLTGAQQQAVAFQFQAGTRSTSGREQWTFEAEDVDGNKRSRSFNLSLRNNDSLLSYHSYTLVLPAPTAPTSRSYLSLLAGLALPSFTLRHTPQNLGLIDLVYLPQPGGVRVLAAPNDPVLIQTNPLFRVGNTFNRRATELRTTTLDSAAFTGIDTEPELLSTFNTGTAFAPVTRTTPLVARGQGRVLAFRTADTPAKTGLIFIQSFLTAPAAAIRMQVRITK